MQESHEIASTSDTALRIVLLEPNDIVRQAFKDVLRSVTTLEVFAADSIVEATDAIIEYEPDFLILRSSWEVAEVQQMLSARPGLRLIVIVSGESQDDLAQCSSLPAAGFLLEEEISPDSIQPMVKAIQRGKTPLPDALVKFLLDRSKHASGIGRYLLTPKENDVLGELAAGLTNKEIAAALGMSDPSVKRHIRAILAKLNSTNRTTAAIKAIREGLVKDSAHR